MGFPARINGQTIEASWFNGLQDLIDKSILWNPIQVSSATYVMGAEYNLIEADSNANAVDNQLPDIVGNDKKTYAVKATDISNGVIITPNGTDTIDGDTDPLAIENLNQVFILSADEANTNWIIVGTAKAPADKLVFTTITADTNLNSGSKAILVNASGGNVTSTLPPVAGANGLGWYIKAIDATNTITVDTADSTIDGASSITLAANESAFIASNGSNYQILSTAFDGSGGGGSSPSTCYIKDVKAPSAGGGNASAGMNIRTLNTLSGDTSFCSILSNQFTLIAGTYEIISSVPGYLVAGHQAYLYDITNAADVEVGTSEIANAGHTVSNKSLIETTVTIAAPTIYEIRQYCTAAATNGLGYNAITGKNNVFAQVKITKVS